MEDLLYRTVGVFHKVLKMILGSSSAVVKMIDISAISDFRIIQGNYINDTKLNSEVKLFKEDVYQCGNLAENIKENRSLFVKRTRPTISKSDDLQLDEGIALWDEFIRNAQIEPGYKNDGLYHASYILERNSWALPSWVWTNASLVPYFIQSGKGSQAYNIAEKLLQRQTNSGGWEVRLDVDKNGPKSILAPNDSAYIANHAILAMYKETGESKFLEAAIKCADWIIRTCRDDGLVWTGYDVSSERWEKQYVIVDTGFTLDFICRLYQTTLDERLLKFAKKFMNSFIDKFFNFENGLFHTSWQVDRGGVGGYFARGQAWALEGLMSYYATFRCEKALSVIEKNVEQLILRQSKDGSWPYNLTRTLYGKDCKGTAVIAFTLHNWRNMKVTTSVDDSIIKSIGWCLRNTSSSASSDHRGGIFSYSTEGNIVHDNYSSSAFVYSNAYILRLLNNSSMK